MNIFSFAQQLLIDPIGFSRTYLQENSTRWIWEQRAWRLYCFPSLGMYVLFCLIGLLSVGSFNDDLMMTGIGMVIMLLLFYFLLATVFVLDKWILRSAIRWTGYEVDTRRADELSVCIIAHRQVIILCGALVFFACGIVGGLATALGVDSLLVVLSILLSVSMVVLWIRHQYVQYRLISQWTDARPMEASMAYWLLTCFVYAQVVDAFFATRSLYHYYRWYLG